MTIAPRHPYKCDPCGLGAHKHCEGSTCQCETCNERLSLLTCGLCGHKGTVGEQHNLYGCARQITAIREVNRTLGEALKKETAITTRYHAALIAERDAHQRCKDDTWDLPDWCGTCAGTKGGYETWPCAASKRINAALAAPPPEGPRPTPAEGEGEGKRWGKPQGGGNAG